MRVHDVSTFEATQFAPLLNDFRKKFSSDIGRDAESGRQAAREDFADAIIEGTLSLRGHEFVLWICNELSLD